MRWVLASGCLILAAAILALPVGEVTAEPASAPLDQPSLVARVLELTNAERGKLNLAPLEVSVQLQVAAQAYSQVLGRGRLFRTHVRANAEADGPRRGGRYAGWTWLGENIAGVTPRPRPSWRAGWRPRRTARTF